jgi:hypothetical protein
MLANRIGEQRRKAYNNIHQLGRKCEHRRPFLAEK